MESQLQMSVLVYWLSRWCVSTPSTTILDMSHQSYCIYFQCSLNRAYITYRELIFTLNRLNPGTVHLSSFCLLFNTFVFVVSQSNLLHHGISLNQQCEGLVCELIFNYDYWWRICEALNTEASSWKSCHDDDVWWAHCCMCTLCSIYPTDALLFPLMVRFQQPGATSPSPFWTNQQFSNGSNSAHLPHVKRRYGPLFSSGPVGWKQTHVINWTVRLWCVVKTSWPHPPHPPCGSHGLKIGA